MNWNKHKKLRGSVHVAGTAPKVLWELYRKEDVKV
jgi:hypothetical protein